MKLISLAVTPAEIASCRELLEVNFSNTAEWRTRRAKRYPNDTRNAEAAEMLMILAETVGDIPDALMAQYAAIYKDGDESAGFTLSELENEMRGAVGFPRSYANATEFVQALLEQFEALLDRQACVVLETEDEE